MHFFFDEEEKFASDLVEQIAHACEGLVYISETDAPMTVFVGGEVNDISVATLRSIANAPKDVLVEEINFRSFFARLTRTEAWHDEAHRTKTKKFLELQHLLEENLSYLNVFKVGRIHVDIYAVGIARNRDLLGVKTHAVET